MILTEWTTALDTLERQLHRQELALRAAGDVPHVLLLDAPTTKMTPEEQVRAIALMQRNDAMITEALALMKRGRRHNATPYSR